MKYQYLQSIKLLFFISMLVCFKTSAYGQFFISGKVIDNKNAPLEFVTVSLKKDSTIIANSFTDSTGNFKINNLSTGNYIIYCSFIGHKLANKKFYLSKDTVINVILEVTNELSEVSVVDKQKLVEKKIDRIIYNPSVLISNTGSDAYETMKKMPTVTADEAGNISIRGLSGTGVMINGRLLKLGNEELMSYLKSIPSDQILKVEIITNPGSKYDAEGLSGLLNIILKENKRIGFNGNTNISYEQTKYGKYAGSIDLNYRSKKFNVFGGTSLRDGEYFQSEKIDNVYNKDVNPYYYYEDRTRKRDQLTNSNKIGADYYINNNNILGIRLEHSYGSKDGTQTNKSKFQKNNEILDSLYNTDIGLKSYNNTVSANVNYASTLDTLGQSISIDFDYSNFYQPQLLTSVNTSKFNSSDQSLGQNIIFKNQASQLINISSIKLDYSKPISTSFSFETGSKFYLLQTQSNFDFFNYANESYIVDNSKSNEFSYHESNLALYGNLNKTFNDKWSLQIGLRNENTFLKGKSLTGDVDLKPYYSKFFPTLFLQYIRNENNQYNISITRRIGRPEYSSLNPFRYYTNPNSYIEGNPFLSPAITNSVELSYVLKQKYFISLFGLFTNGQITQVPILDPVTNSYKYVSINLDNSYNTGLTVYLPIQIAKWWQSSISAFAGLNGVNSNINQSPYKYNNINFQIITNNQYTILEKNKLYGELNFSYQPKGATQGLFILGRLLDLNMSIKKVFKGGKCSLSLSFLDILNSAYITAKVDQISQYSFINGNYDRRSIRISFSYNFGKKSLEKSREKKSSIEEERKRIKE